MIAGRLGLTGALGTVAESVGGVYTGRLVGEPLHGPAKAEAVRALATAEILDLTRCAAYSDSHNDIPMLSLVGHPYAINPDAKLRKHARARDWRLRDYRTGRKAAKVGIPAAAGVGAVMRRHGRRHRPAPQDPPLTSTATSARTPPRVVRPVRPPGRLGTRTPGRPRTRTHVHPDEPSGAAPPMSTTHPHPPCIDPVWSTTCHSPTLEPTPIDNRSDVIDDLSNWA